MSERISLKGFDGEELLVYVVEETKVAGVKYLLVAMDEEGDSDAFILRESQDEENAEETVYDVVEDDDEFDAVAKVFEELVEDTDFE